MFICRQLKLNFGKQSCMKNHKCFSNRRKLLSIFFWNNQWSSKFSPRNMVTTLFLLCLLPYTLSESVCRDESSQCPSYQQQGLCNDPVVKSCMTSKCPLSCGICQPLTTASPTCDDNPNYKDSCPGWVRYCKQGAYVSFMRKNCKKTCGYCGGPATTVLPVTTSGPVKTQPPSGKSEFPCDFETDHCHWVNEPLEDGADWAIGTASNGPTSGAGSSAKYAFLDSSSSGSKASLFIPWELVLPLETTNKGSMCLVFQYVLSGGSLRVIDHPYPTANNKSPSERTLSNLSSSSSWTAARVKVNVDSGRKVVIEGSHGGSGTTVAIDDVKFVSGQC